MNELTQLLELADGPVGTITIFAIIGTIVAYMGKWAWSEGDGIGLGAYMFGDLKAFIRAVLVLAGAIMASVAVGIPDGMDFIASASFGLAIGATIPDKVSEREKKLREKAFKKGEPKP